MGMMRIHIGQRSKPTDVTKWSSLFKNNPFTPLAWGTAGRHFRTLCEDPLRIGVLRETYDKWERRAPLCPEHVEKFLSRYPGSEVIVQPSPNRVFSCKDYEKVGARIQDDLAHVDLILGVKRPRSMENLPSEKTYMFFSHVIKGQTGNMPLLESCLEKRIQLIDYECIVEPTLDSSKSKRVVAFGKFAGYAGMVDTFPVLGRRLLMKNNWSTPFLHCPSTIHHYDLAEVKQSVTNMAARIAADGLPANMPPLIFAVTGKDGCVYGGVREILDILPHETVGQNDLLEVVGQNGPQFQVYIVAPEKHEIYQHNLKDDFTFDRSDFMANPHLYKSNFARTVAPYVSVIINTAYWDYRFPRILTKDDMKNIYRETNERLLIVNDISCDPRGAIEFFERSTTIDRPSYQYDPLEGREVTDHLDNIGITMLGIDILPTELPADSSRHFGNALTNILDDFVSIKKKSHGKHLNVSEFPDHLRRATITTIEGVLNSPFQYLDSVMKLKENTTVDLGDVSKSLVLHLEGHLFDSGLINHLLDLLEQHECFFEFEKCFIPRRSAEGSPVRSQLVLKMTAHRTVDLIGIAKKVRDLVDAIQTADATLKVIDESNASVHVKDPDDRAVLVLGSGMVSKSLVELLGRSKDRAIIVASDNEDQARHIARFARRGRHVSLDIQNDTKKLTNLIDESDLVISMLPASMHPPIAELCIKKQKDLVTASYESDKMREYRKAAQEAGILILNEVGLDPGLDHMSVMRMIDDIRERGGSIMGMRSVCGGLPAPEAADNPLKYKFSWNPMGVLSASQQPARYRENNVTIQVDGDRLLNTAVPFRDAWSDLQLECLPNRDSLYYEKVYGIQGVPSIFRGTLRYEGFSSLVRVFRNMGFFGPQLFETTATWEDIIGELQRIQCQQGTMDDFVRHCADGDEHLARRAMSCLKWLHMTGRSAEQGEYSASVVDLFCMKLEERLKYATGEADMVVMHHTVNARFDDGSLEEHSSSMQTFGDESMTAMCRTVGYATAASADLILRGTLMGRSGLILPTEKEIYRPVLDRLAEEGIVFHERVKVTCAPNSNMDSA